MFVSVDGGYCVCHILGLDSERVLGYGTHPKTWDSSTGSGNYKSSCEVICRNRLSRIIDRLLTLQYNQEL